MTKKVVNIDPEKRISEKSLTEIKEFINSLTPETARGLFILSTIYDTENFMEFNINRYAHNIDWEMLGMLRVETERLSHWYYDEFVDTEE